MKPTFIIGEQRSGSNLLRLMLAQAGIAAPHPPHLLQRMLPLVPSYGDLSQEPNWQQLVEDACLLIDRNPVPWTAVHPLDRQAVSSRCRERSLVAIFGSVMDLYAQAHDSQRWACKSMQMSHHVDLLESYFDGPKYIHLYRDGRDVALSFKGAVVGDKHVYFTSKRWASLQRAALRVSDLVGPQRFFGVQYERLVQDPESVLRPLCEFLESEFRPSMMEFHKSDAARSTSGKSQLWENVHRPVMRNNTGKFMAGLTVEEIQICESVAGPELDALGYARVQVQPGEERTYSPEEIAAFHVVNTSLKADRRSEMDTDDAARREHQLDVLTDRVPYLEEMPRADRLTLLSYVDERHIPAGVHFICEGEVEQDMYLILDGEVEVLETPDNVLCTLGRGEWVGEIGALAGLPRTRTLRTSKPTRLLCLSRSEIDRMAVHSPVLAAQLLLKVGHTMGARLAGRPS